MAQLVAQIKDLPPETPIGTFRTQQGQWAQVKPAQVTEGVRCAARLAGLASRGFDITRIGTHSLRAGGAVALKLAGYDETTIMKLGRWSSQTYLLYIRNQISATAEGLATGMAASLTYHNVG